jgi:hypothetical protein
MGMALGRVVAAVESDMSILVPYVDNHHLQDVLQQLDRRAASLEHPIVLRIVISQDPVPYVTRVGQLETLEALLTDPNKYPHLQVKAKIGAGLHAKVYLADTAQALVTSGNLTGGGMSQNIEAGFLTDEVNQLRIIRADFERYWNGSTTDDFDLAKLKIVKQNLAQGEKHLARLVVEHRLTHFFTQAADLNPAKKPRAKNTNASPSRGSEEMMARAETVEPLLVWIERKRPHRSEVVDRLLTYSSGMFPNVEVARAHIQALITTGLVEERFAETTLDTDAELVRLALTPQGRQRLPRTRG